MTAAVDRFAEKVADRIEDLSNRAYRVGLSYHDFSRLAGYERSRWSLVRKARMAHRDLLDRFESVLEQRERDVLADLLELHWLRDSPQTAPASTAADRSPPPTPGR